MTPTSEELERYGLALAALLQGASAEESPQGYLTGKRHFVVRIGKGIGRCTYYGPTPINVLSDAAESLGLEPVELPSSVPAGMVLVPIADVGQAIIATGFAIIHARETVATAGANTELAGRFAASAIRWVQLQESLKLSLSSRPADEAYLQSPGWQRQLAEAQSDEDAGRISQAESVEDLMAKLDAQEDPPTAQQTTSRLRRAIEYALEDASVEGRHADGRPAYVSIGMHTYQGLVDALSATEEPRRDKVFRDVVGVMLKEMDDFLTFPEDDKPATNRTIVRRWMEMIEAVAAPEQEEVERP